MDRMKRCDIILLDGHLRFHTTKKLYFILFMQRRMKVENREEDDDHWPHCCFLIEQALRGVGCVWHVGRCYTFVGIGTRSQCRYSRNEVLFDGSHGAFCSAQEIRSNKTI